MIQSLQYFYNFMPLLSIFTPFYAPLVQKNITKSEKQEKIRSVPTPFFSNQQLNDTTGQQGNKSISRRVEKCAEYKCPLITYNSSPDTTSNIIS